jgi:thioredoxin 1
MGKAAVIIGLIVVIGVVLIIKDQKNESEQADPLLDTPENQIDMSVAEQGAGKVSALPRLVDLGAGKCIPCKMMAPILEELKSEYAGKFEVVFVDVWENPDEGKKYGIKIIPTQIFYDTTGKERFRHEGFFSKEDILGKWKELGFEFESKKVEVFSRLEPAVPDTRDKDNIKKEMLIFAVRTVILLLIRVFSISRALSRKYRLPAGSQIDKYLQQRRCISAALMHRDGRLSELLLQGQKQRMSGRINLEIFWIGRH